MRLILNILWVVLGGFFMMLGWVLAALLMAVTIVGLPWVPACLRMARFVLWPFGYMAEVRTDVHPAAGALGCVGNVLWFVLAGWWLAIGHLMAAFANFITIIGIPFGWQHLKMLRISLAPIGMVIVPIRD